MKYYCNDCGNKLQQLKPDPAACGWADRYRCDKCGMRMEEVYGDKMGGGVDSSYYYYEPFMNEEIWPEDYCCRQIDGKYEYFPRDMVSSSRKWDDEIKFNIFVETIDYERVLNFLKNKKDNPPTVKVDVEDESDDLNLKSCEQCGEKAWDGYICHSCGMKHI